MAGVGPWWTEVNGTDALSPNFRWRVSVHERGLRGLRSTNLADRDFDPFEFPEYMQSYDTP